jgi:ribosome maturation factor RimP
VFVDKPGGVGIGDCERVSREVGDLLDVAGLIDEAYDLEVSSPGLERQLRTDREFRWALGKRVRCWLAGGEEFRGRLADVTPERLVLDRDGERVELARGTVTKARLDAEVPWPRRRERRDVDRG